MIKYMALNPETGHYDYFATKEEALEIFWKRVIEIAKNRFHGTAYISVEINSNGEEIWKNDCEEIIDRIPTPQEIDERLKTLNEERLRKEAEFKTPVETLP